MKHTRTLLSTFILSVSVSSIQAAELIEFSNGEVADANDVNANFSELAQRIENISGTIGETGQQGPQGEAGPAGPQGETGAAGPQGPAGPQGVAGARGADGADGQRGPAGDQGPAGPQGPAGLSASDASLQRFYRDLFLPISWNEKRFIVADSRSVQVNTIEARRYMLTEGDNFTEFPFATEGEIRESIQTLENQGQGFGSTGDIQILTYAYQVNPGESRAGSPALSALRLQSFEIPSVREFDDNYDNYEMLYSAEYDNPVEVIANQISVSEINISERADPRDPFANAPAGYEIVYSKRLTDNASVSVQGYDYTGCHQVEVIYEGQFSGRLHELNWYCGNGTGLVKSVGVETQNGAVNSWSKEFDPDQSTPISIPL